MWSSVRIGSGGELVEDGVGWELTETDRVVIRRPKVR